MGDRSVRIQVIAEVGVNHNGDMGLARRLIDAACDAGADFVKFQTFRAASVVVPNAEKADYQAAMTGSNESQQSMLQALELSNEDHRVIMAQCAKKGIGFISTAFDMCSVDLLADLGVSQFKIPSGEITSLPYLRRVGRYGRPTILSTGMATLGEIEAALDVLEACGTPRGSVTVLHCNSAYPSPMSDVNLRAMVTIRDAFGVAVGYSDHTNGIEVPIAAAALGATLIEKHLTLDRELPGPDHQASLEPHEFGAMVRAIRNIELALGDGIKRPTLSEMRNRDVVRKSIVAGRRICSGEVFEESALTIKRPGIGLSPMRWDEVLGRRASRDYDTDELIEW